MKNLLLCLMLLFISFNLAYAKVETVVNTDDLIFIYVKKEKLTTVNFPEPVIKIIRGVGLKKFDIRKAGPTNLLVMPFDDSDGEALVVGVSGANYHLYFKSGEDYHIKLEITTLNNKLKDDGDYLKFIESNPPEITIPKQSTSEDVNINKEDPYQKLPKELNSTITLAGVNMPLKVYLNAISKVTGRNIIMTKGVEDSLVSIDLNNIEVWRALKSLLYPLSYGFKVNDQDIIILTKETRVFDIKLPSFEQSYKNTTTNSSSSGSGSQASDDEGEQSSSSSSGQQINIGTDILVEHSSEKLSLWKDLQANLAQMVTPGVGSFSLNKSAGNIVVTDLPGALDKIGAFIDQVNTNSTRQQSFEIQIIEVTLNNQFEMGIDFNALARNLKGLDNINIITNLSEGGFTGGNFLKVSAVGSEATSGVTDSGVSSVLKALETMGKVEVISKPSITCTNLIPCVIQEGSEISYISGIGSVVNQSTTQTTVQTKQLHQGIIMGLVARIDPDYKETTLDLSASVSNIDSITTVETGNNKIQIPQVSLKSISTTVGVKTDESLIIGGLISSNKSNTNRSVPVVSKMPILGKLFQYDLKKLTRSELVIIITPKVK